MCHDDESNQMFRVRQWWCDFTLPQNARASYVRASDSFEHCAQYPTRLWQNCRYVRAFAA